MVVGKETSPSRLKKKAIIMLVLCSAISRLASGDHWRGFSEKIWNRTNMTGLSFCVFRKKRQQPNHFNVRLNNQDLLYFQSAFTFSPVSSYLIPSSCLVSKSLSLSRLWKLAAPSYLETIKKALDPALLHYLVQSPHFVSAADLSKKKKKSIWEEDWKPPEGNEWQW